MTPMANGLVKVAKARKSSKSLTRVIINPRCKSGVKTKAAREIKFAIPRCARNQTPRCARSQSPRCARNQNKRCTARGIKVRAACEIKSYRPPGGYFTAVFRHGQMVPKGRGLHAEFIGPIVRIIYDIYIREMRNQKLPKKCKNVFGPNP
jgi:hypothetical protein